MDARRGDACWDVGTEREDPSRLKTLGDSLMNVNCRRKPFLSVWPGAEWEEAMRTNSKRLAGESLFPDITLFCLLTTGVG